MDALLLSAFGLFTIALFFFVAAVSPPNSRFCDFLMRVLLELMSLFARAAMIASHDETHHHHRR